MWILTINKKACYGPESCDVQACLKAFTSRMNIHDYLDRYNELMMSSTHYSERTQELLEMERDCPASAISITIAKNGSRDKNE